MTGISLTRITKAKGELLSKRIALGADGNPDPDGSECRMTNGKAERITLDADNPAASLATEIGGLKSSQAIALGNHVADDQTIDIVTAKHADPSKGQYARTQDFIKFAVGQPAPVLLDYDRKAMPADVAARIEALGGFEKAVASLLGVDYQSLARVIRTSTSSGIYNKETGEQFPAGGGLHVYLFVKDGDDIGRFLKDLQDRACLNGLGWLMLGKIGQALIRSIVDSSVGGPERLIFEGKAKTIAPLDQDQGARAPIAHEGDLIDTLAACPPLTADERAAVAKLRQQALFALKPEVEKAKEKAAEALAEAKGITKEQARTAIASSIKGNLTSWSELHFDDDDLGIVSVADVLADPGRYHGETLADPLEGRDYGTGKAKLYHNGGASVFVNSMAHGGGTFSLRHSIEWVERAVEEAGKGAAKVFAKLVPFIGDHDPIDFETVRNRAAELSKIGKAALNASIDRAEAEAKAEEAKERARKRAAEEGAAPPPQGNGQTFDEQPAEKPTGPFLAAAEAINKDHFVVQIGPAVLIGTYIECPVLGRRKLAFMKQSDFRLKFVNRNVLVGFKRDGTEHWLPLGDAWLTWADRRQYKGAGFYCHGEAPYGVLNLWQGWGYPPKEGSWDTIAWHLLHVICDGNQSDCDYLIGLLAYWVQNPDKVGEVSIVLQGLKRTGKGSVADILKRWFLHHHVHISQSRHLTGNFNSHLADNLFVFADEVVWGGDKQAEGALKALITERTMQVELKGVDSFSMPNLNKVLQASNSEWCVPVSADERRFFVNEVSDAKIGNSAYFDALHKAIQGGEAEAMLAELLQLDLSNFDHRSPPHTKGLNAQKVQGLDSIGRWWMSCLDEGRIVGGPVYESNDGTVIGLAYWPGEMLKGRLHYAYVEHSRMHGEKHPTPESIFSKSWRRYAPSVGSYRPGGAQRRWQFQSLEAHRAEFLKAMRIDHWEWPEKDDDGETVVQFPNGKGEI